MNDDLDSRLRAALEPVAPDERFTQELIARVTERRPAQSNGRVSYRRRAAAWWLSASAAASLLIAAGVEYRLQELHARASGLEARRQVMQALRVTGEKLNLAYETMKSQSSSLNGATQGG